MDFSTVPTLTFSVLYCFFVISYDRRQILYFNVTRLPSVKIRTPDSLNARLRLSRISADSSLPCLTLLIWPAMRCCVSVNPVFFRVAHATTTRNLAGWSGPIERARKRTIAKCLGSVTALARIPVVNDHLNRHEALPHARPARGRDFHCQRSRNPFRCQRRNVLGLTLTKSSCQANSRESRTIVNRIASVARRGLTSRRGREPVAYEGRYFPP